MTTLAPTTALTPLNRAATLLRVLGVIELPAKLGTERPSGQEVVGEILATGALPTPALIDALLSANPDARRGALAYGVQALRDARGDAPSLPQLREFALHQTADTGALFQERLAAWYGLAADDAEHCAIRQDLNVLPGTWGTAALGDKGPQRTRACATGILSSATQGACAICHMRVGDAQDMLRAAAKDHMRRADRPLPARGVDLAPVGHALVTALQGALEQLAAASTPPSDQERSDLNTVLQILLDEGVTPERLMAGLVARGMPQREVRALVTGQLIALSGDASMLTQLQAGLGLLPTDLLRVLDVWGGGSGTLARAPIEQETSVLGQAFVRLGYNVTPVKRLLEPHVRVPRLSRPQRRAILSALESSLNELAAQGVSGQTLAWEAVHRHAEAFKRVLRKLHVHEWARHYPHAAALAGLLAAGGKVSHLGRLHPQAAELARTVAQQTPGEENRARSLMGGVELAMGNGQIGDAAQLLAIRSGLLGRSLDRLLREESRGKAQAPATLDALTGAAPRMTAAMVAGLHAHVERRAIPDNARSFRSRGKATVRGLGDTRQVLHSSLIGQVQNLLENELLRRGAEASELGLLEIDPQVLGVRVAASARASSGGLEGLAAGSTLPLTPEGAAPATTARLFMHWAEKERAGSIDLDLSAMAYNASGKEIAHCTFSSLRQPGMVHSGDLRSAPLPVGATEYIDLDLAALRKAGATLVIASVYSFTSIPFSQMERASCGLMSRVDTRGGAQEMDLSTVRLKFELRGEQTSCTLLAIDLREPGHEQVIFLELPGDRGGYQVIEGDPMNNLALQITQAGQGMPLTLLVAPHLARAAQVRCGEQNWIRAEGESREDFARRVQLALMDRAEGRIQGADAAGDVQAGPGLLITDQPQRALQPGDTVITLRHGVTQPSGVAVHGLRGLLDTL
ncbi:TerD family protein [Deinococcus sp. QL22]|uniref:TerD family protein n=1 Tax=Deinococcus sp. QL22 TaxID=2939437 RepID=UPI0020173076|nr:TerD family protein [Deinococcus sp. QL22]UQN08849.1 TerD family protein [Deinococcus sp. QL22]